MGNALKIFITLNLIMSAIIATLGYQSFSERKLLRAEAVELEQTISTLATDLQWGADVAWETPEEKKSDSFTLTPVASADDLDSLESNLDELSRFAYVRQTQLTQRNNELTLTKSNLASTISTLASTESKLATIKIKKADLDKSVMLAKNELNEATQKLATVKSDISEQERNITNKNGELTDLNNNLADLEITLDTRIDERDAAQAAYDRCRIGTERQDGGVVGQTRGKKGQILAVNQDWQYVVLDKGEALVEPNYQAFVHRGDDYVGKLQITQVEDNLAIAQIIPGSMVEGAIIKPGDELFF
ncbi:hypothetical protein P3T73_05950 [Kiritimatiellota bacterium B12222]|nr:hypothetical protein P3T73_05950 [Kiritimatiellota bacterium B12222]